MGERMRSEHKRQLKRLRSDHAAEVSVLQGHIRGKENEIQAGEKYIDGVRARLRSVEGQLDDSFQANRMLKEEINTLKSTRESPVSASQGQMRAFGDQGDALKKQRDEYEIHMAEMKNRFQKDLNDMEMQLRDTEAQNEKLVLESSTAAAREQIEQLAKER